MPTQDVQTLRTCWSLCVCFFPNLCNPSDPLLMEFLDSLLLLHSQVYYMLILEFSLLL